MTDAERGMERARANLRQALELWDAADLSKIRRCQELIERASGDLRAMAQGGSRPLAAGGARQVAALRKEVQRMIRMVDACSAFQRGLWLSLGHPGQGYGASGQLSAECGVADGGGLEG